MKKEILKTDKGNFSYFCNDKFGLSDKLLVLVSCMGFRCAYYDYYSVIKALADYNIDIMALDLLGMGYSGEPVNAKRNLKNITDEGMLLGRIGKTRYNRLYICCHSFTALYILQAISLGMEIDGFIGIDPSASKTMNFYKDELKSNLKEAQESSVAEVDVNPNLSGNIKDDCQKLYVENWGNKYEISELRNSLDTITQTENLKMPNNIPCELFLSSLNFNDYLKFGNPYLNDNPKSLSVELNGHHFLHWIHPDIIAKLMIDFIQELN